jgi:hypothetical protein
MEILEELMRKVDEDHAERQRRVMIFPMSLSHGRFRVRDIIPYFETFSEDAFIHAIYDDFELRTINIVVSSLKFPTVPEGQRTPFGIIRCVRTKDGKATCSIDTEFKST